MNLSFLPEGGRINEPENVAACATWSALQAAREREQILEGQVLLCNAAHELIVQVGPFLGRIPRDEAALGVSEGVTKEIAILSRVGKPICFTVTSVCGTEPHLQLTLSRRRAQQVAQRALMETLRPGMVIPAVVTHLEPFGAFVDIGCGVTSMIGIEHISVSRIPHPNCRFAVGQRIFAAVLEVQQDLSRVRLTHRELLGTWSENAAQFPVGLTVQGFVRGIKDYGVFIELAPNLSGLSELRDDLAEGDRVSVFLKAVVPEHMKIKLVLIDRLPPSTQPRPCAYFISSGRIAHWQYAPAGCEKTSIETNFL